MKGTTPRTGTWVRSAISSGSGSRSARSPRNRLISVALTSFRSWGSKSSIVPSSEAKTPPRLISPTRITEALA